MHSDVGNGLTEERRALIGRYMIDAHATPAGVEREEPMRREALEVPRQDPVEHARAVAAIATEVRRKMAEERARREGLEAVVRRATAAEAHARRQAEEERARYEALQDAAKRAAAAVEEQTRLDAEEARELREAAAAPGRRRAGDELTTRVIQALARLQESSDAAATRLERLTWALVLLSASIAAFAIAVFVKG